mmetsp:Transcript_20025/g.37833  ORF Transcript_20025/g.37833 Transcript_20025/m.37833 type:complete len:502 (+) Transcript_20025:78-1583(+)
MGRCAVALAFLACAIDGRRVQHSMDQLQVRRGEAAFVPSGLPVGIRPTASSSKVPRAPQTRIASAASGATEVPQKIAPEPRKADIKMLDAALGTQTQLLGSVAEHEQQKDEEKAAGADKKSESTPHDEKEPWYGNLRRNAMILVAAKMLTRVALLFRRRSNSLGDTVSAGSVSRVPTVAMNAEAVGEDAGTKGFLSSIDIGLILCVSLWYLGNYYYNITNKLALNAALPGGVNGAPLTVSTLQLVVGAAYALFLWSAPDARKRPTITFKDWVATLPVSAASAAGHGLTVFAFSAGSVSFGQIVKAAEPACAALLGLVAYGTVVSRAKWLSLIPVIGGVCLASAGEINFAWAAFLSALASNLSGAVRANENKKLMSSPGISERLGCVGNQYAISTINQLIISIPFVILFEGNKLGPFFQLWKSSPTLVWNTIYSGMWYYLYNELSTIVIKKTNAVTQTVLSTAKRVIIIVGVALVLGESLPPIKLIGSLIGIAGVFAYSLSK